MIVGTAHVTLHIPEARSLKDKRQVLQGLIVKLRDRHNASVLELEDQDVHQRAVLGAALVGRDRVDAERRLQRLVADVETLTGLKHIDARTAIL